MAFEALLKKTGSLGGRWGCTSVFWLYGNAFVDTSRV